MRLRRGTEVRLVLGKSTHFIVHKIYSCKHPSAVLTAIHPLAILPGPQSKWGEFSLGLCALHSNSAETGNKGSQWLRLETEVGIPKFMSHEPAKTVGFYPEPLGPRNLPLQCTVKSHGSQTNPAGPAAGIWLDLLSRPQTNSCFSQCFWYHSIIRQNPERFSSLVTPTEGVGGQHHSVFHQWKWEMETASN